MCSGSSRVCSPIACWKRRLSDGAQPMQVVGVHADIDRGRPRAKLPQVKVVPGGRPIQDGIQPEVQARGEGLADRARGHGREIDDVIERPHALPRQRKLPAVAPLDDALPVLTEALIVGGHPLPQHFPDGLRERRRLEEVERDAEEQRPGGGRPEGIDVRRIGIEHLRDPLQVIDAPLGILRDVVEGVPAGAAPILREGIKEVAGLASGAPEARGRHPVLALDVDADHRVRPVEKVRDHDPGPLAGPRRGGETHALLTREHRGSAGPRPRG